VSVVSFAGVLQPEVDAAQQLAEADSAGARIGRRLLPAGVGYREVDLAMPPSRREACFGRRLGLEYG
jgi:hypothetical protein